MNRCFSFGHFAVVFTGHQVRLEAAEEAAGFFHRGFAAAVAVAAWKDGDVDSRFNVRASSQTLRVRTLGVLLRQLQMYEEHHGAIVRSAIDARPRVVDREL